MNLEHTGQIAVTGTRELCTIQTRMEYFTKAKKLYYQNL